MSYPSRMTRVEYMQLLKQQVANKNKRTDDEFNKGLVPFRRPLDKHGKKLKGEAYDRWLQDQLDEEP